MAWDRKPHLVSLGSQKNFERFMAGIQGDADGPSQVLPDITAYKAMIAKAIIFKTVNRLARSMFKADFAQVTAYTVAVLSEMVEGRMDLDRIWNAQTLSIPLQEQLQLWAREVNGIFHASANGRAISEWAKKQECWDIVLRGPLSAPRSGIPEIR